MCQGRALTRRQPPILLAGGAVALLAAVCCLHGIGARDLTGDELWGGPGPEAAIRGILAASIDPRDPDQFTAHAPLSWVLRWIVLACLGDDRIVPWRLHAALGAMFAALATWWVARRNPGGGAGCIAGLLVATSPLLTFHARDSSNYALSAMFGIWVLAGLAAITSDRRWGAPLLGTGLLLGICNDYLFVFPALAAAIAAPVVWGAAEDPGAARRRLGAGFGIPAVGLAVPGVVLAWRSLRVPWSTLIAPHADPSAAVSPWSTIVGVLRDLFVVQVEGHALEGNSPWDIAGIIVAAGALSVWALARREDPLVRVAAVIVVVTAGLHVGVHLVLQGLTGRDLVTGARGLLSLLPLVAVVWVRGLVTARRLGVPILMGLLALQLIATARQQMSISRTQSWALERIASLWQPGDGLLAHDGVVERLAHHGSSRTLLAAARDCAWEPLPPRLWIVAGMDEPEPTEVMGCDGRQQRLDGPGGYEVRLWDARGPPRYERFSNSFLQGMRVVLLERGASPSGEGERASRTLRFGGALGSGTRRTEVRIVEGLRRTGYRTQRTFEFSPELPFTARIGTEVAVSLHPIRPRWTRVTPGGLADAYDSPTAIWPSRPVLAAPIEQHWEMPLAPLSSPGLLTALRALRFLLGIAVLAAVIASAGRGTDPGATS